MKYYQGYLINAQQATKFLKWYLANPIQNQFPWAYHDINRNNLKQSLQFAENHPRDLFFGSTLNSLATGVDRPNDLVHVSDQSGRVNFNGIHVKDYIRHLKKQTLVPYDQVQKMATKVQNEENSHEKRSVKKDNRKIKKYNAKIDQQITKLISNYGASVDDFTKYFGNYDGTEADDTGLPRLTRYKHLISESNKAYSRHKKLNSEITNAVTDYHLTSQDLASYFFIKHGFMYARTGRLLKSKMDVYEAVAILIIRKKALATTHLVQLNVPHVPAFKHDLDPDTLAQYTTTSGRTRKNGTPLSYENYITDPNEIADYEKIQKLSKKH